MRKSILAILAPVFVLIAAAPAHAYHAPVAHVEGEDMSGVGRVISERDVDRTSGGALRRLEDNGRIWADLTATEPATHLVVDARGGQSCDGWPRFFVRYDGARVGTFDADTTPWYPYAIPLDIAPGTHQVEIVFINAYSTPDCARSLRVDDVEFRHLPWHPFALDSLWNRPASEKGVAIPNPYPDENLWLTYGKGLLIGGGPCGSSSHDYQYRKPIYFADANDPVTINVTPTIPEWQPRNDLAWDGRPIPIPAGAKPAEGSDGHLTIIDPDRKVAFEFWRATSVSPLGIVAATVSMYRLDGPGYSSFNGENSARGSGLPVVGSTLRAEEAYWGVHHALGISVPSVGPDYVSPASKSDGDSGPLEYGQLYVLRPDFPIPADAPRGVKNVLTGLQVYGGYIADQGSNFELDADSSGDPEIWCAAGIDRTAFESVKPSDLMLVK